MTYTYVYIFSTHLYVDLLAHIKYFEYINDMIRQDKKIKKK